MDEKKIKDLQDKVTDYSRYGFILLSLGVFLFLGLVIPTDSSIANQFPGVIIGGIFLVLGLAMFFNRRAKLYRMQLEEDIQE